MNIKKALSHLVPKAIVEVLTYEAIQKDRAKAEANQAEAEAIRSKLLDGYHAEVEANSRLVMYILGTLDPGRVIHKREGFTAHTHIQDLAICYLKYLVEQMEKIEKPERLKG